MTCRRFVLVFAWFSTGCAVLGGCATPPPVSPVVVSQDRTKNVVLSVDDWSYADRDGQVIRTEHYRIYTTATDHRLRSQSPAFLELAFEQYTTGLADLPTPTMKLDTFLLDSRWQWTRLTKQLMGDRAELYLRIGRGGYSSAGRAVLYDIGPRDTLSIAAHEGWHQYTQRTFKSRLPVWLEEGVATYMEGFRSNSNDPRTKRMLPWANTERFDQLRAARARGETLKLRALLDTTPESLIAVTTDGTLTYYAQVWALTHFLHEGEDGKYQEGLRRFLIDAAEGRVSRTVRDALGSAQSRSLTSERVNKAVFHAYFSEDLATVEEEFERFMTALVRTGSRDLIVRGQSPFDETRPLDSGGQSGSFLTEPPTEVGRSFGIHRSRECAVHQDVPVAGPPCSRLIVTHILSVRLHLLWSCARADHPSV